MKNLLILCSIFIIGSCKKIENNGLVGKWRLSETYDGYVNGGSFSWHKVALENSHVLEFTVDNKYYERGSQGSGYQTCYGSYRKPTTDTLEITSSCQTVLIKTRISELTSRSLILDNQVIEGFIRNKYVPEK